MTPRTLSIVPCSDVDAQEVSWLIPPYIPLGKLTLLEGDPESGKSYLAIELAAAVTTGRIVDFSGIQVEGAAPASCDPANVLYFSGEEGVADTLKPRLLKQRGDPSRLFFGQGIESERDGKKFEQGFTLSCISELQRCVQDHKVVLVIIDPLQAFLGAKVDMHRANEVRPVLTALGKLAEDNECAILIIRHLNKSATQRSGYRGMGSIDFTAAARSVLLAGLDPHHPPESQHFALVHTKCSIRRKGSSLTYSICDTGLFWTGTTQLSADDLLGTTRSTDRPVDSAIGFLRETLAAGPKASTEVQSAADQRGISPRTLQRAKEKLGVLTKPSGFQGSWYWELPQPAGSLPSEQSFCPQSGSVNHP